MLKKVILSVALLSAMMVNADNRSDGFIDSLLAKMTLKEKIGQLNQLHCENWARLEDYTRKGIVGSVMSITNPGKFNEIQRVAVNESRLGIPLINARDVIHGFKTIFPIPLGQAATFDLELVKECAAIAAKEATAAGIRWTFAPMVDITHDPRWGRIAECLGEDPYLASKMGVAMVNGFQSEDLSDPRRLAACAKHFAGYGATEGGRDYNSTFISENRMRNLYLRPFQACVNAGVSTLMSSFNDNDGYPSSGNRWLLTEVLRNEWGFKGAVVSDWEAITEMVAHRFCADNKEAALRAITAGVDIDMVSNAYTDYLPELIKEGKVSMTTVDDAVRNVLRLKHTLGLFENPYCDTTLTGVYGAPEHLALAQRAAEESIVLLKNDNNILPYNLSGKKVLLVGPLADAPAEQLGTWAMDGDSHLSVTPLKALQNVIGKKNVTYIQGLDSSRDTSTVKFKEIKHAAENVDIIIAMVGEEAILSGEAHCLTNLNLQGKQSALIHMLSQVGKPLVTIVMAGRPLDIANDMDASDALLYCFAPGTMGGPAIINTISGVNNPSAKLPVTFPQNVGQIPIYYNHNNTGRPADGHEIYIADIPKGAEQTALGNKSYYLDANGPLFSFGDGLSYTTYHYSNLAIDKEKFHLSDSITVSFDIDNVGKFDGTEILQVYISDLAATIVRPILELVHFDRVFLKSGESKHYQFNLPISALSYWNGNSWGVEPGRFDLFIGGNTHQLLKKSFEVAE